LSFGICCFLMDAPAGWPFAFSLVLYFTL